LDGIDEGGVEDTYIGAVQAALTKAMATYMLLVGRIGAKLLPSSSKREPPTFVRRRFSSDCRIVAGLLLKDNFVSTGMFLTSPHSLISDRVNMPAILCHFL
jgi:hypothetical protein